MNCRSVYTRREPERMWEVICGQHGEPQGVGRCIRETGARLQFCGGISVLHVVRRAQSPLAQACRQPSGRGSLPNLATHCVSAPAPGGPRSSNP